MTEKAEVKGKPGYMGFFSIVLAITLISAVLIWIVYGYLPGEYYLPLSLIILVCAGIVAYFILINRVNI